MHKFAFVLSWLFLSFTVNAAQVVVYDGDQFNFDPADTYLFVGELSASNTALTYGVNLDVGETFDFFITAPDEFDFIAVMSTGPNGSGTTTVNPNGDYSVYAGTTYIFPASWLYFAGQTNWLTVGVGSEAIDIINNVYGGSLPIGPVFEGHIPQVPEPATFALMLSGLALLGYVVKRRKYQIAV